MDTRMKNWFRRAALASTVAAVAVFAQQQQQQQQGANPQARWITANYTKVDPANAAAYEKLVQGELAKVARARIDSGDIEAWAFQRVLLPAGADAEYTHVTLVTWKDKPILDAGEQRINSTYVKAGVDRAAYIKQRNALGAKLVRTQILRRIDSTASTVAVGDFVRVDPKLVNPRDAREYVELERAVYKANHEQRIQRGALKQWSLFSVSLPGGPEGGFNFATSEVFKDEGQMFGAGGPGPADPAMRNTQARMNTIAQQKARRVHRVLAIVR
jgi:hypothetical protein